MYNLETLRNVTNARELARWLRNNKIATHVTGRCRLALHIGGRQVIVSQDLRNARSLRNAISDIRHAVEGR